MGRAHGGLVQQVLVENSNQEGTLTKHTTKETIQEAIFSNIHCKRFFPAEAAPICNGGVERLVWLQYRHKDSTSNPWWDLCVPPRLWSSHKRNLWRMRSNLRNDSHWFARILIAKEEWRHQWQGCRESTSSSESGLHFGHYIAGISSDHISYFHALKATLILHWGVVLDRWACSLSVMLEKMFGCALITKLWSILLMEADFNATNKIIYGHWMLHQVQKYKLIPEEIYSKRNHLADNGTLTKVLYYDIVRQVRLPVGISAVDADNCYDRIAHPIASLVFQARGVPQEAVVSMLSMIPGYAVFPSNWLWGL